jgi:hypothetical protein
MSLHVYPQLVTSLNSQRNTAYDILCTDCQSIFDDAAIGVHQNGSGERIMGQQRLHLTFGALMRSAERGCHLCNQIFGCLQDSLLYAQTNGKASENAGIDLQFDKIQLSTTMSTNYLSISGDHPSKSSILWGSLEITPVVRTLVTTLGAVLT